MKWFGRFRKNKEKDRPRPKFVPGEPVVIVASEIQPVPYNAEIISAEWYSGGECGEWPNGSKWEAMRGWYYKHTGAVGNAMTHERGIRKRPDQRKRFSLEDLKNQYPSNKTVKSPDEVSA